MIKGIITIVIFSILIKLYNKTNPNPSRKKYGFVIICSLFLIVIPAAIGVLIPDENSGILGIVLGTVADILSLSGWAFLIGSIYKTITIKKT